MEPEENPDQPPADQPRAYGYSDSGDSVVEQYECVVPSPRVRADPAQTRGKKSIWTGRRHRINVPPERDRVQPNITLTTRPTAPGVPRSEAFADERDETPGPNLAPMCRCNEVHIDLREPRDDPLGIAETPGDATVTQHPNNTTTFENPNRTPTSFAQHVGTPGHAAETRVPPGVGSGGDQPREQPTAGRGTSASSGTSSRPNYVQLYQRFYTRQRRAGLMLVGHSKAGKTSLLHAICQETFREPPRTEGIDLSSCRVTRSAVNASDPWWQRRVIPPSQRISEEMDKVDRKIANESQPNAANDSGGSQDAVPNGSSGEETDQQNLDSTDSHTVNPEVHSPDTKCLDLDSTTDMTIWDMSGEFCFYKTHQMFLFPDNIYIIVLDASLDLDSELPESCATQAQRGKIECPRTSREFLSYWLNTICTFTGEVPQYHDLEEDPDFNIMVVLTHTDLMSPEDVAMRKKEVLKHVQKTDAHGQVDSDSIFALSNKTRNPEVFQKLKQNILELCCTRPGFNAQVPCTWLKLEEDTHRFALESGKRFMTTAEFEENVIAQAHPEMPRSEWEKFLQFHGRRGSLIYHNDLIVTDPQFLVDAFATIITKWESRDLNHVRTLRLRREIEQQLEKGCLSFKTLFHLWKKIPWTTEDPEDLAARHELDEDTGSNDELSREDAEQLLTMMTQFRQFVPCPKPRPGTPTSGSDVFLVPGLLPPQPPDTDGCRPYVVRDAEALHYLFHLSSQDTREKETAFLPNGFFFSVVSCLIEKRSVVAGSPGGSSGWSAGWSAGRTTEWTGSTPRAATDAGWSLTDLTYNRAELKAGSHHDILVRLTTRGPTVSLQAFMLPEVTHTNNQCRLSSVRQQLEMAMTTILQEHPNLNCSVCVLPCDLKDNQASTNCLQVLGPMGKVCVRGQSLRSAACTDKACDMRGHLPMKNYNCWFCIELNTCQSSPEPCENKILWKNATKISTREQLVELGVLALDEDVQQRLQDVHSGSIKCAALEILRKWSQREVGFVQHRGTPKSDKFCRLLKDVGIESDINC